MAELEAIRARYARRTVGSHHSYDFDQRDVFAGAQQLDAAIHRLLLRHGFDDFAHLRLLEVGCGKGANLLRFLRWGFAPENLVGNELLEDRVSAARHVLPQAVQILPGDARELPPSEYDLIYQGTVLSSILSDDFQEELCQKMWSLLRPGGGVISYDFQFNNPANPDVRKVTIRRLHELFPMARVIARRVTLAPPIARRASQSETALRVLQTLPFLRSHAVVLLMKPASTVDTSPICNQ